MVSYKKPAASLRVAAGVSLAEFVFFIVFIVHIGLTDLEIKKTNWLRMFQTF